MPERTPFVFGATLALAELWRLQREKFPAETAIGPIHQANNHERCPLCHFEVEVTFKQWHAIAPWVRLS